MRKRLIQLIVVLLASFLAHASETASCRQAGAKTPAYEILRRRSGGPAGTTTLLFIYVPERESYGKAIIAIACDVYKRGIGGSVTDGWIFADRDAAKRWTGLTEYPDYWPHMWALRGYLHLDPTKLSENTVEFSQPRASGHVIEVGRHVVELQVGR